MNTSEGDQRKHWRLNVLLTATMLVVWFVFSFGITYFARQLDFRFFGWPFSFWVAAQGALLVFVALIALYAWLMERLDLSKGVQEPNA